MYCIHRLNQLTCDGGAFKSHDTLLCAAETQQVDAAVPYNFLICHCKFLMDVWTKYHPYTGVLQESQSTLEGDLIYLPVILCRSGYHDNPYAVSHGNLKMLQHLHSASTGDEWT